MMVALAIAKFVMRLTEARPAEPDMKNAGDYQEIFRHPMFTEATPSEQQKIMLASARARYDDEMAYPWDLYFGRDLCEELQGASALDLGCFTGGRAAAWYERYRLDSIVGVDVADVFIESARLFSNERDIPADFSTARGEKLPLDDSSVDAVLSFDVFEHVQNLPAVLDECHRVLRPGGKLYTVFPSYWHPIEHHLGLATNLPFIHYIFGSNTLTQAYNETIRSRPDSEWYRRQSDKLERWERLPTINGTTHRIFRDLVRNKWTVLHHSRKPLLSVGRNITKFKAARFLSFFLRPLASIPVIDEFALHRITYTLCRA